ncbi:MAG: hypothetical protein A2075_16765 [Geobacteraceae bacterium GWC2_58_44]|nr:MAG: hypothetical protein A2075_16765 [Geobacteraceae bacterium GWC2_58_44]HBG04112.1 hypothetical protein [Geobacter sp.]
MGIPEDIARLELELRELIVKYEQYFFGVEKREPLKLLEEVERLVMRYRNVGIPNTMQRFKYDSLAAALSVHKQKWTRINRLMEEGKYERDRFKMSLRRPDAARERGAEAPPPASELQLDRIYQEYRNARVSCNLPVENLSREKIAQAIERQKPAIMEKYRCSDVSFVVVIEDGKPRLKARPKSS